MPAKIENKEPGYFSSLRPLDDLSRYALLFSDAAEHQTVGEASGAYLTSQDSADRIASMLPEAKIIIMLRNPADRAYSLYKWMTREGYEHITMFERALSYEHSRLSSKHFRYSNPEYFHNYLYFTSGLYSHQLRRYLDNFDRSQIHFIVFEDFVENPIRCTQQVFNFLGVENSFSPKTTARNKGRDVRSVRLQFFVRQRLGYYLSRLRIPKRAHAGIASWLMEINKSPSYQRMPAKIRQHLLLRYAEDIQETGKLVGIDLSARWLP